MQLSLISGRENALCRKHFLLQKNASTPQKIKSLGIGRSDALGSLLSLILGDTMLLHFEALFTH